MTGGLYLLTGSDRSGLIGRNKFEVFKKRVVGFVPFSENKVVSLLIYSTMHTYVHC